MHVKKTIINSEKLIFSQVLRQFLNIGFYCGHTYLLILLTDLFNILGSGGHADDASLTTFSSVMTEQLTALTNSLGEIQQRLVSLEENVTLSSMVSITVFSFLCLNQAFS